MKKLYLSTLTIGLLIASNGAVKASLWDTIKQKAHELATAASEVVQNPQVQEAAKSTASGALKVAQSETAQKLAKQAATSAWELSKKQSTTGKPAAVGVASVATEGKPAETVTATAVKTSKTAPATVEKHLPVAAKHVPAV